MQNKWNTWIYESQEIHESTNESCLTNKLVIFHIWIQHKRVTNESRMRDGGTWRSTAVVGRSSRPWKYMSIRTSHVSHMNESCLRYERVLSHIWMSHVSHMNESCPTYERVTNDWCETWRSTAVVGRGFANLEYTSTRTSHVSHIYIHMNESCPPRMNESRMRDGGTWRSTAVVGRRSSTSKYTASWSSLSDTCVWVMSYTWMSHVTHMDESRLTYRWFMSQIHEGVISHIHYRVMPRHSGAACVTPVHVRRASFISDSWIFKVWLVTHSYVGHDSSHRIQPVWHRYMSHVTHTNESYHKHMNESCHKYMNESCHTYVHESCHKYMNESCRTYVHESCHSILGQDSLQI